MDHQCSMIARRTGFAVLKQIPSNVTLNCTSGAYPVSGSCCKTRLEGGWLRWEVTLPSTIGIGVTGRQSLCCQRREVAKACLVTPVRRRAARWSGDSRAVQLTSLRLARSPRLPSDER